MGRKSKIERDFEYVPKIEYVETNAIGEVIRIDGVKYQHIPPRKMSRKTSQVLMMAQMFSAMSQYSYNQSRKSKPEGSIGTRDLVTHWAMIKQKISELTASERSFINWKFEREFEKIEEEVVTDTQMES